jgi:hypothetical protein
MKRTKEQLTDKLEKMQAFLETKSGNEPHELIDRIELLSVLISQSGDCLADAKYLQDQIVHSEIMNALKSGYTEQLTASALNKFVNSLSKDENYLVNAFDRTNSAAVHQLDGLRSILSYRKAEFTTLSYGK